ncbi:MAG: dihydrodipicolinate synthase family protein [Deltaproteobacteria bacterium]|nr:dihydrodipicolinate synthase family protein [Deltaproteobacteria bacterium]
MLSGEGDLFLPILALGGAGGILTVPNVLPKPHVELFESFQRGDLAQARLLNHKLMEFSKVLSAEGKYHAAIKAAMRETGIPIGIPRRPLTDVSPQTKERIRKQLEILGLVRG